MKSDPGLMEISFEELFRCNRHREDNDAIVSVSFPFFFLYCTFILGSSSPERLPAGSRSKPAAEIIGKP